MSTQKLNIVMEFPVVFLIPTMHMLSNLSCIFLLYIGCEFYIVKIF